MLDGTVSEYKMKSLISIKLDQYTTIVVPVKWTQLWGKLVAMLF